jgi:hypothetical protein
VNKIENPDLGEKNMADQKSKLSIQVSVTLQKSTGSEAPPTAVAYAFSGARLLTQSAIDAKGMATLSVPASQSSQDVRVVVGPEISDSNAVTLSELTRRGAQTNFVRVTPGAAELRSEFQIPIEIWPCWIRRCPVQGTLLKRVYSSGVAIDYPVSGAKVGVYEVQPIFYIVANLTDIYLEKIRQYLLNPQPLPPNPPDPGPVFARLGQTEIAAPVSTLQQFSAAAPEFESIHRHAITGNLVSLRQALTAVDESALRYLICYLFPEIVTKTLVTTLTTDRCGRFHGSIFLGCNPRVNLYFEAYVTFFGFPLYIYKPTPVSCYTWWNYACGTEVTLYTNSVFAPLGTPCAPIDAPENYVLFRAIGNIQLNGIYGASNTLATTPANIGLAADFYGAGLDAPFGNEEGTPIYPRVEFDSSLRASNLAMYYQMSYRKGTTGAFTPLTGEINRKINQFVAGDLVTSVYNLGPKVVGSVTNLFEIPTGVPASGGDWAFPNPPVDLASAQFPSTDLPAPVTGGTFGDYQLKLDLFDAAGNAVNLAAAGIAYYVPSTVDPDGTIHTVPASTLGLVSGNSFIMTIHIDNRPTAGSLGTPALNGNPADACGVFRYTPGAAGTVTVPYTATHPANFATYSYQLSRGATLLTPPTTSGQVSAATNPATYSASVLSLLTQPDGSVCDVAGFAEDLYVAAMATDGWRRLSVYDRGTFIQAFVLAPQSQS